MVEELTALTCRICGEATNLVSSGRAIRGYALYACGACETVQVRDVPAPQELKAVYDQLFADGEYEQHRREFEALKEGKNVRSFLRDRFLGRAAKLCRGRTLVEIGGGTGKFGLGAKRRGWQYKNYDISQVAVDFCRRLGLDAEVFPPETLPPVPPASADAIVMWEVLEHIWRAHDYLTVLRRALRPGGMLFLSVPNYRTPWLRDEDEWSVGVLSSPPLHVNFFDPASLQRVLEGAGFANVSVVRRRFYRPYRGLRGIIQSLRFAALVDEPPVMYATCTSAS